MSRETDNTEIPGKKETAYKRRTFIDSRASWLEKLQWRFESFAWDHVYWKRFGDMDVDTASRRGAALIRWMGPKIGKSANRTAKRNLKLAFPEWSEAQISECLLKSWENFGHIAAEFPHLKKFRDTGDDPRLTIVGEDNVHEVRKAGKPCVFISCHRANWELLAYPIIKLESDAIITYRSANNPFIDRKIAIARIENAIPTLAAKGTGTRDLMRALNQGRSIGLMNDQKFNEGLPVPFFGYDAMTAPGPTRMAHRYKCPLVPVSVLRTDNARYTVEFHSPIWTDQSLATEEAVAQTLPVINSWVEDRIREAPEQWFWQHNRWPKEAWKTAGVM